MFKPWSMPGGLLTCFDAKVTWDHLQNIQKYQKERRSPCTLYLWKTTIFNWKSIINGHFNHGYVSHYQRFFLGKPWNFTSLVDHCDSHSTPRIWNTPRDILRTWWKMAIIFCGNPFFMEIIDMASFWISHWYPIYHSNIPLTIEFSVSNLNLPCLISTGITAIPHPQTTWGRARCTSPRTFVFFQNVEGVEDLNKSGWRFQPLWKILVNLDDASQYMGK